MRPVLELLEGRELPSSGLTSVVTTNHMIYRPGEPIVITLTETNATDHDVQVFEGPSLKGFKVSQGGHELWRSNSGVQAMFLVTRTLHPGESLTQAATWDGETPEHRPLYKLGTYLIRAETGNAPSVIIRIATAHPHGRISR